LAPHYATLCTTKRIARFPEHFDAKLARVQIPSKKRCRTPELRENTAEMHNLASDVFDVWKAAVSFYHIDVVLSTVL
jgi:hypothetical protein